MRYGLDFRPYRRQFKQPLQTSHGLWQVREGIILRLTDATDAAGIGWGEIAPLDWFGSESFEQALDFCRQLPAEITTETVFSVPSKLPACQFGFESAWEALTQVEPEWKRHLSYSALLPAGEAALHRWQDLWRQGYRTFKWKIGVAPLDNEIKVFERLIQALPTTASLRLDANGGLSDREAREWLQACDPARVEFLEQPLPVTQFDAMQALSTYPIPLALDESVATLEQLNACYQRGWRGIFVIKPAIAGSPTRLRQFCQTHDIDAVFSSVFETAIARQAVLKLAAELPGQRAVGFGVSHWFNEDESPAITDKQWTR